MVCSSNRSCSASRSDRSRDPSLNRARAFRHHASRCALSVSSHDLAVMAATFANGGVNPVTGDRVIDGDLVPKILAVMTTAGLYDDSGIWLYEVGLPGKSGVGGGIIAVAPGRFGIAAFAPPLDEAGNSVKAWKAIDYIVERMGAGLFLGATEPAGAR